MSPQDEMPLADVQDLAKALDQALRTNAALNGMMKSMVYVVTGLVNELHGAGYISKNKIVATLNERISSERLAIEAAERSLPTPRWLTEDEFQELCDRYKVERSQQDRFREMWCRTTPATDTKSIVGGFHSDRESHRYELRLLEAVVGTLLDDAKPSNDLPARRLQAIDGGKA